MSVKLTYVGTEVEKRKLNLPKLPKFMRFLLAPFIHCIILGANTLTWISNQRAAGDNIVYKIYQVALSGSYVQGGAIGVKGEVLNGSTAALPANTAFEVPPLYGYTSESGETFFRTLPRTTRPAS